MICRDDLDALLAKGSQTGGENKIILRAVSEAFQTAQAHWLEHPDARHTP